MASDGGARQLAMEFAQMSRTMLDQPSVERTLQGIVELAARTVDGATSAGITVVGRDKRLITRIGRATRAGSPGCWPARSPHR